MTGESPERSSGPGLTARIVSHLDRYVRVFVLAGLLMIAFGAGMGVDRLAPGMTGSATQRIQNLEDIDEFTVLAETYQIIRENYVQSEDISDQELIYGASRGMVDALGDEGHSRFMDPAEAARYLEMRRGSFVGIGISVDSTVNPPRVIMPYQNSPAFHAGIRQGDVILAVDGVSATDAEDPMTVVNLIGGDEGTDVTIELRHEGDIDSYTVTITRARIELDPTSWAMMPNGVLWVRLQSFNTGASEGLAEALRAGHELGARGVILDLRANPGGLAVEALAVGTQLQQDGTVLYQTQDAEGRVDQVMAVGDAGEWQDGPLVVLIDNDSASASEVVSSGVQDNGRGPLIGQTTFGTGTTIIPVDVSDGSIVMIGISLWLSPDGNVIWHRGVEPDIEVENEPGVQMALPYLFDDNEVTDQHLAAMEDVQLLTAYDEVIGIIED